MLEPKNILRIFIDVLLLGLSFFAATIIRLEGDLYSSNNYFIWHKQFFVILPFVLILQISILWILGNYKRFWRYTSTKDLVSLLKSLLIANALMLIPRAFGLSPKAENLLAISYGILLINFFISLALLSASRIFRAYLIEQKNIKRRLKELKSNLKSTLIIGAGEAGLEVIKSVKAHPELALKIVGILDDDKQKHQMKISGIKVLGAIKDVEYFVSELDIDQIIIAIPSLKSSSLKTINQLCSQTGADIRIIPGVDQLAGGQVNIEQIRKLSMEDLLGREELDLHTEEITKFLANKKVLVTGAGGSIGKELCKQLVKCQISDLCLVGKGENSIFEAYNSLDKSKVQITQKIADIRNYERLKSIIEEFQPDVIFHAAAHKHVHLMELNVCEAFENNVIGTRNLAELAGICKIASFVLISTDKAVNPTSIMGSTKNLAEKITLIISRQYPKTKFTAVRFGNVLGSRGSVIKVWEKQLANNLPLTITHEDAIRYFMTIPEASQLVIQASAKADNGQIMVLDMGEPVKISDLAKQFIRLSGFDLDDVKIQITGLKEGEKLYEELLTSSEFIESKLSDKIYKAKIDINMNDEVLIQEINELEILAKANDTNMLKDRLKQLMIGFNQRSLKAA